MTTMKHDGVLRGTVIDDRGVVAVEFAIILAVVGTAVLLGAQEIAPVLHDWVIHLQEQIMNSKASLAQLQAAGCN